MFLVACLSTILKGIVVDVYKFQFLFQASAVWLSGYVTVDVTSSWFLVVSEMLYKVSLVVSLNRFSTEKQLVDHLPFAWFKYRGCLSYFLF